MSNDVTRVSGPPIRVGIIGAGYFGGEHMRAIRTLGRRLRVVAVASRTHAAAAALAGSAARAYGDWRQLLADPDVDAVCICTPHDLHESIAVAAANAGKAVMLEKPMAMTVASCDRIAVAAETVPFMVAQPSRFVPAFALARQLIDDGRIGRPVYARVPMVKAWQLDQRRGWHLDPEQGGGMWMTNAIHLVDRLCWLLAGLPTAVSATIDVRCHDMPVDDVGVALFRFGEGRTGVAEAIGYASGAPDHDTVVLGTSRMLRCHHHNGVSIGSGETWTHVGGGTPNWRDVALVDEWRAFVAHIDGAASPVSAMEARAHMAAVLAARKAAATGTTIALSALTGV
jgi:phthalate 4,5-cis-dihydrodiol dehydrogenase